MHTYRSIVGWLRRPRELHQDKQLISARAGAGPQPHTPLTPALQTVFPFTLKIPIARAVKARNLENISVEN